MNRTVRQPVKPRITSLGSFSKELPDAEDGEIELSNGAFRIPLDINKKTKISSVKSVVIGSDLSTRVLLYITQSELKGTKFVNAVFEANIKDVRFIGCKFLKTVFEQGIVLERVEFIDCQLQDCSFYKSTLKDVSFVNSSVVGVGFDATTVERVSLVSSVLTISDPATLKGCILSNEQIIGLSLEMARTLGIIINPQQD